MIPERLIPRYTQTMLRYIRRAIDLGPLQLFVRIKHRTQKKLFYYTWKKRALAQNANHTWEHIAKKHHIKDFKTFLEAVAAQNVTSFIHKAAFQSLIPPDYTPTTHRTKPITHVFYQDITYGPPDTKLPNDIRLSWEHNRFQHLYYLGKQYHKTKDPSLIKTFTEDIETWIQQNPLFIGYNWACTMEVAIRAINWIVAFEWFKHAPIPKEFLRTFFCSLYDHMFYIEHNWETSDRPNNHYLSDLVGYFFLISLFPFAHHKRTRIIKEFVRQCTTQILPDGGCYEGSTSYHAIDTELLWLFLLTLESQGLPIPQHLTTTLQACFTFLKDTQNIRIGDDDSGKILTGFKSFQNVRPSYTHYPNFGLSLYRTNDFCVSLRHPRYTTKQPTGHFHDDAYAITLSYKNIPILVDPGSYIYTADKTMRNLFRSYQSHTTFYPAHNRDISPSVDIFQNPQYPITDRIRDINIHRGQPHECVPHECASITDTVLTRQAYIWTFVFHPSITLRNTKDEWHIYHNDDLLLILTSDITLYKKEGFYAPRYGTKETCHTLTCNPICVSPNDTFVTQLKPHKLNKATELSNKSLRQSGNSDSVS